MGNWYLILNTVLCCMLTNFLFNFYSVSQILKSKAVNVEWEETDEEEAKQKMKTFFTTQGKTPGTKRHPYFTERNLKSCTHLF